MLYSLELIEVVRIVSSHIFNEPNKRKTKYVQYTVSQTDLFLSTFFRSIDIRHLEP